MIEDVANYAGAQTHHVGAKIAATQGGPFGPPHTMSTGARCDRKGMLSLINDMSRLATMTNMSRAVNVEDVGRLFFFADGRPARRLKPMTTAALASIESRVIELEAQHADDHSDIAAFVNEAMRDKERVNVDYCIWISNVDSNRSALRTLVEEYREKSSSATCVSDKLLAVAQFYLAAERLHPFMDANYRTFGQLILNFNLLTQGLSMTDIYDPNCADGSSPEQIVDAILDGQDFIKSLSAPANNLIFPSHQRWTPYPSHSLASTMDALSFA
jgi:hypothetical protein